ncbi:hypothetical protein [Blastococcus sp. Marseille-P5729]|uniref:hypothetical protein n=1 Tax=Blastococcus sp. Marseille-P5729 TaxID=2086582 RepID=UPI000D0F3C96|nr:hypothetical protein [Blastococcus sp. Marseille-P5729]
MSTSASADLDSMATLASTCAAAADQALNEGATAYAQLPAVTGQSGIPGSDAFAVQYATMLSHHGQFLADGQSGAVAIADGCALIASNTAAADESMANTIPVL